MSLTSMVHTQTFADFGNEKSTAQFPGTVLNAGNFAAQTALIATLISTVTGITLGAHNKNALMQTTLIGTGPSANHEAVRELKWLVRYHDTVTMEQLSMEIPCPDISLVYDANHKLLDITTAESAGLAFATAFVAYVKHDTNAVAIDEVVHVGRNL